jgi:NADH:ubiquinone oxidoreductase subunit K
MGQIMALLFVGVAASESVIGLGLLIIFFKRFTNINLDTLTYFSK